MPASLAHLSLIAWLEPGIGLPIAVMAFGYYLITDSPLRARLFGPADRRDARRNVLAYAGFVVLYLSFGGPLDVLADTSSFAAHMLQHTLGTMVAPPLFLAGMPTWLWERILKVPAVRAIMRILTHPVVAIVLFNVLLALSVLPVFYDFVEVNPLAHFAEHAGLFVFAMFMWWPVASRAPTLPRLHPGLRMLYMFLDGMPMIFTITFPALATAPMYPYYAHAPLVFGLSHVAEQQLGGALMILLMHIAYGVAFIAAFIELKNSSDQQRIDPILTVVRPDGPASARFVGKVSD